MEKGIYPCCHRLFVFYSFTMDRTTRISLIVPLVIAVINIAFFSFCQAVINGEPAGINECPFTVNIQRTFDNYHFEQHCTGVIIKENWILTAAHCVERISSESLQIIAGDYHRSRHDGTEQLRQIAERQIHPSFTYNQDSNRFDIVLLRLTQNLSFGDSVRSVTLPRASDSPGQGHKMEFSGWGSITPPEDDKDPDETFPDILQKATLVIVGTEECKAEYLENTHTKWTDFSGKLCGSSLRGDCSPCRADSGGGAFCGVGSEIFLCGILSYNSECDNALPSVFTLIDEPIVQWIKEHTCESSSCQNHSSNIAKNIGQCFPYLLSLILLFILFRMY